MVIGNHFYIIEKSTKDRSKRRWNLMTETFSKLASILE